MQPVPQQDDHSITKEIDDWMRNNPNNIKAYMMLNYVRSLHQDVDLSQLLMAKLAYMCFSGNENRLIYDAQLECWWLFEKRWYQSKGKFSRVKAMFQRELLPLMFTVVQVAQTHNVFPVIDGDVHPRLEFLQNMVTTLSNAQKVQCLITESAMFFDRQYAFDENPDLFQLTNCDPRGLSTR
jgi:hypothetical protein